MPLNPTITTFNNQTPPWSLAQLDANFASIASIINSANNYSNYLVDTGSANAYAVTFGAGIVITLTAGLTIQFKALNTNTGSSTLNVNSSGVKNLVNTNGQATAAGQIVAGGIYAAFYDGTNYQLLNPTLSTGTSSPVSTSRRQTVLIGPTDITGMPSFLPQTVTGLNLTTQNISSVETIQTSNVSTPVASPGIVTWTGHTLVANQAVSFTTNGSLPTGLTSGVTYYVVSPATNTFEVALTPGGTPINFTGSTSGQSVAWAGFQNVLVATSMFGNDFISGELNVVGLQSANLTWTGLTNNTTNYLYVTISGNGVLTPAFTTLAPIIEYESTASVSTTAGQITIRIGVGEVYLGNGSAAVETPLVLIGTATTSGGNITATQTYNYGKPPVATGKISNSFVKRTFYGTAGTFTWVKQAQTTSVHVICVNGTGGGGGYGQNNGTTQPGGPGGPGGGFTDDWLDASAFNSVTVTVGAGGLAGAESGSIGGTGGTGGNSTFGSFITGGTTTGSPYVIFQANAPGGLANATAGALGADSTSIGSIGGLLMYQRIGGHGGTPTNGNPGGIGGLSGGGGGGGNNTGAGTTGTAATAGQAGWVIVEEYN